MICPYKFIEALTDKLDENAIVVCANGTPCVAMFQAGKVKKGQRIFWNSGTASMGYALPAAIGACFASGREVICIEGDGSLMMNIQELQTVRHYNLPIKLFVFNNGGYHSIQETQDNNFDGRIGCDEKDISFPDLQQISFGFGLLHSKIRDENQIEKFLDILLFEERQFLCEVILGDYKFRKQEL